MKHKLLIFKLIVGYRYLFSYIITTIGFDVMYAGGVLKQVDGLTYKKLNYFVCAGYVNPKKIKKKSLYYSDFSEEDVELIKRAWELISKHNVSIRAAFKGAKEEVEDPQLTLNLRTSF